VVLVAQRRVPGLALLVQQERRREQVPLDKADRRRADIQLVELDKADSLEVVWVRQDRHRADIQLVELGRVDSLEEAWARQDKVARADSLEPGQPPDPVGLALPAISESPPVPRQSAADKQLSADS